MFSCIFGGSSLGTYNKASIGMIKKNFHILQKNKKLQTRQIHDEFALITLIKIKLGTNEGYCILWI